MYVVINQYGIEIGKTRRDNLTIMHGGKRVSVLYMPRDGSYEKCAAWVKKNDSANTCAIVESE